MIGAAWTDDAGQAHWGWPGVDAVTLLHPAPGGDWRCCLLPPALSLALCMRRCGTDLGLHAAVLGNGVAAGLATAVAEALGCRMSQPAEGPASGGPPLGSAPIVIETSGERSHLETALALCADWGVVYSMAGGLSSSPVDYYTHVHRRALTVCHVPDHPASGPGDEARIERGAAILVPALQRCIPGETGAGDTAVVQPGHRPARLLRDGSGLCLVTVADP